MSDGSPEETVRRVVDFARILRLHGIGCTIPEVIDASAAVLGFDADEETLREALRATLVKRVEYYGLFDELFDRFWGLKGVSGLGRSVSAQRVRLVVEGELDPVSRFLSSYSPLEVELEEGLLRLESLRERSRSISRGLRAYSRMLALKPGRRRVKSRRGRVDFRRTLRASLSTYGEVVRLLRSSRKKTRARLIALLDVSGSMKDEWDWIYDSLRAFKALPPGSYEVFLFSTRLKRITHLLESQSTEKELARTLAREFRYWGSGTRIGDALEELVNAYSGILGKDAGVLIVSDGWDLGDLRKLESLIIELRRRVSHVAWLTPHASKPGFKPVTACLRIVSKHVDALLPSTCLEDPRLLANMVMLKRAS